MCMGALADADKKLIKEYTEELDTRKQEQYDNFLRYVSENFTMKPCQASCEYIYVNYIYKSDER